MPTGPGTYGKKRGRPPRRSSKGGSNDDDFNKLDKELAGVPWKKAHKRRGRGRRRPGKIDLDFVV